MGYYIDWKDVANRYADVAKKLDANEGELLPGIIDDAESEVNGRLAPRYAVPFTPGCPPIVQGLCIDLAYYKAVGMQSDKVGPRLLTYIQNRFDAILAGNIVLVNSDGSVAAGVAKAFTTNQGKRSSFGMQHPEQWAVSSDWQQSFVDQELGDGL